MGVLTIKIPKAFSGEFKARREEVTEVTQKAMLEVLTKQDILHYFTGGQTPNGDTRRAVPEVVEKIFGYLDMDALTQARAVSLAWKGFVDSKTPYWKTMTSKKFPKAATDGRLDIVERMIEYGEPQGFTHALESAVTHAHTNIVKRILPLMDRKYIVKPLEKYGFTFLRLGAIGVWGGVPGTRVWKPECTEIFKMLIEHFYDKNPRIRFGTTPMHYAAQWGHKDCVKVIMDAVEEEWEKCPEDGDGSTPLHLAAKGGHIETCRLINEYLPENKNKKNDAGKTPANLARERGHTEIVELFNN